MISWLATDIGVAITTILGLQIMTRDSFRFTRNEKIYAIVVGIAYFVCLGLLCKQVYDLSQFPEWNQ